ncbi:MAG: 8-oxo-dGTP pyrophosphatase MutT (NUDIX family) [Glaciecola sp.]|jgi:8-oxo-dGTP pyrophosphatase MutT (NUDIX family)
MSNWFETVSSDRPFKNDFFSVRVDEVSMPDGSTGSRSVVEHVGAVAIVPLMDDGTVVLLRQYRHAIGGYAIEIPAGRLDVAGEDVEAAAHRELVEEIGHQAGRLRPLGTFHNSVGWTDEVTHLFVASQLQGALRPADFTLQGEEADMEILRLPMDVCLEMIQDGAITDAKTVIGLLRAPRQ